MVTLASKSWELSLPQELDLQMVVYGTTFPYELQDGEGKASYDLILLAHKVGPQTD